MGATAISASHTDRRRGAALAAREHEAHTTVYRPLPPRMRLVPIAVSTTGAIGREGQRFLAALSRRTAGAVPPRLLTFATWATPRFAPFVRMAIGCAVRRALATSLRQRWHRTTDPADYAGVAPADGGDDDGDGGGDDDGGDGGGDGAVDEGEGDGDGDGMAGGVAGDEAGGDVVGVDGGEAVAGGAMAVD